MTIIFLDDPFTMCHWQRDPWLELLLADPFNPPCTLFGLN